jgi:DNA-binding beta-propeller fold protein YncE
MHAALLLLAALAQGEADRPPLGLHLADVDGLPDVGGVWLGDDGGGWCTLERRGELVRFERDGARRVVAGGLVRPRDVEVGAEGDFWISEPFGRGVVHLGPGGEPLGVLGAGVLASAGGLELDGDRLLVTDLTRHRVEVFGLDGEHRGGLGGYGLGPGSLVRPVDVAVDGAGQVFVTEAGTSRVQVFDAEGESLRTFGDWGPFLGLFVGPTGIEVRGEEVFVADEGNHRVQVFSTEGKRLDRFGMHAIRPREGAGYLHYPTALALSPSGEYAALCEPSVDRIQLFCRTGGTEEDSVRLRAMQLAKPAAHYGTELAIAGPWLVIGEPESHSVLVFENTYDDPRLVSRISGLGAKTGLLTGVAGLAMDRERREVFVCDPLLRRLSVFRLDTSEDAPVGFDARMPRFVRSLDLARLVELTPHPALAGPPEPVAVALDGARRVYLADRRNGCVLVLSPELDLEDVWLAGIGYGARLADPAGLAVTPDGGRLVVTDGGGNVWEVRRGAEGPRARRLAGLDGPHGVTLAPDGTAYLADAATHQVVVLAPDGEELRRWGSAGLGRQQMYKPRGVALDHRGHVTVLDHANHRLMRFTPEGEYARTFGLRLYTKPARLPDAADGEEE